jgi:hypothetical protein
VLPRSRTSGLIPIVRLLSPAGVAAVGAGREPDVARSVDSASLFRESSSPATALRLDQSGGVRQFVRVIVPEKWDMPAVPPAWTEPFSTPLAFVKIPVPPMMVSVTVPVAG